MSKSNQTVHVHQTYRHHSGRTYTVTDVTNEHSDNQEKFPLTVVYVDQMGRTWSRPAVDFLQKMTLVSEVPDVG